MVSQIFNILTYPVNVVFGWFYSVLNATGLTSFLFATLILVLIGAIVILPIRGANFGLHIGNIRRLYRDEPEPERWTYNTEHARSNMIGFGNRKR